MQSAKIKKMNKIKEYLSFELFFWIIVLIYLASINPNVSHFSFCLFKQLGISWCPGCGIGRSISHLLHGDIIKSINNHIFGTFALLIIVYRILQLIIKKSSLNKKSILWKICF